MLGRLIPAVAIAALAFAVPACASVTLSFTGGTSLASGPSGNILSFSNGGVAVQASAWSNNGSALESAWLADRPLGLGVVDNSDPAHGALSEPSIDTQGQVDLILLVFDQAVNLQSAVLTPIQVGGSSSSNAAAIGYGTSNGLFTAGMPAAITPSSAIWSTLSANQFSAGGNPAAPFSVPMAPSTYFGNIWTISGDPAFSHDRFQLTSITVNASAVPEPSTWGLYVLGFLGTGVSMRRRNSRHRGLSQLI